jgi:hypothetical protein
MTLYWQPDTFHFYSVCSGDVTEDCNCTMHLLECHCKAVKLHRAQQRHLILVETCASHNEQNDTFQRTLLILRLYWKQYCREQRYLYMLISNMSLTSSLSRSRTRPSAPPWDSSLLSREGGEPSWKLEWPSAGGTRGAGPRSLVRQPGPRVLV